MDEIERRRMERDIAERDREQKITQRIIEINEASKALAVDPNNEGQIEKLQLLCTRAASTIWNVDKERYSYFQKADASRLRSVLLAVKKDFPQISIDPP